MTRACFKITYLLTRPTQQVLTEGSVGRRSRGTPRTKRLEAAAIDLKELGVQS